PVLVRAVFELERDDPDAIVKRMKKAWILRKTTQPVTAPLTGVGPTGRLFKNPRGLNATALIEEAGLARTRVGGAELSEREANSLVVHPGATTRDVLRLIDLARSRVQERFGIELELDLLVW